MQMHDMRFDNGPPIDSYGPGFFRIQDQVLRGPVVISPNGVQAWQGPEDTAFLAALAGDIDVILLGMGNRISTMPKPLRSVAMDLGIAVEVMATPPACRTYNVLLAEGRRIAVALLPIFDT